MNGYPKSDLACEILGNIYQNTDGIRCREEACYGFRVIRQVIETQAAADRLGKPKGHYTTVECGKLHFLENSRKKALAGLLAGELRGTAKRLTGQELNHDFGVFVAGLGNAQLTADAVGPQTVARLTATRHLREHENALYRAAACSALSALAPGVLGQTGIETVELVRGAVRAVKPDVLVVIDALSARSCDRLATTVQIADSGISPGSGVGNHRAAIDRESIGIPVIAVGVPTVVNSATLVYDALRSAGIAEHDEGLRRVLESGKSFFVSPKESDVITQEFAALLAAAINKAFTGMLSIDAD